MKSITIHKIDEEMYKKIKTQAKVSGLSLNKTIKILLEKSLGITKSPTSENNFSEFLNLLSKEDAEEFYKRTEDLRNIDERDWN